MATDFSGDLRKHPNLKAEQIAIKAADYNIFVRKRSGNLLWGENKCL